MKIKKLRMQSFRNHADSTLDLQGTSFCIIRGANASGKSSIAQAISVNLTNTTMGLPGDGKGYTSKIKDGSTKAVVTAEIQGQHLIENTVTMNMNTSGRTVNVECLDDPDNNKIVNGFKTFLADRKSALLIAANTDHFHNLEEKAQTDLLAKLVLPAHYDFPKDKIEATNGFLDTPISFDAEPFDVITQAYKGTYKQREITNRQVKEFTIPDALPIPKDVDSETLQTQLTGIKEKRTKLQTDRDAAVKAANEIEVKRATLQTKRESLLRRRDEDQKKLAAVEAKILSEEQVQRFTDTAAKADELAKLKLSHSAYIGGMRNVDEQIDRLTGIAEKGATCPTCDQDIDTPKIGRLIEDLKSELAKADAKLQELDTMIEAIGDVQAAKDALKNHETAVKEKIALEASLEETVKEGKKTRAELDALGEAVNATLPFNDPLADLQAKEEKINEQLRPVIAAEERASEIKRLTAQKEKLVAKAATLDSLVKYFDKDGIKKDLIGQYVGGFESKINTVMDAFGCKASLSFDPIGFDVTTTRGYVGPLKELCGAEGEIFKRAFQCAVSIAAGINMVVIDEMEELGEDIRPVLFRAVYGLIDSGQLEQAIMIGFSLDKNLPKPQAPGSKYFFVNDGMVEELK